MPHPCAFFLAQGWEASKSRVIPSALARVARCAALIIPLTLLAHAQDQPQNTPLPLASQATLHGVVKNAATGEPLPRVLVSVGGESGLATLTDGDGRFEIDGVAAGPNTVQLTRPGFEDAASGSAEMSSWQNGFTHNVIVAPDMPDVAFVLRPTNIIRGQIQLSTGDPAENIDVELLQRVVNDGRAVWNPRDGTRTNADGAYRFAGLPDGVYAIATRPALDGDIDETELLANPRITVNAYPATFYPDARDFTGATRIRLSSGQEAQANLNLVREPFHMVRATITSPSGIALDRATVANTPAGGNQNISSFLGAMAGVPGLEPILTDTQGRVLPYIARYDAATHSVIAMLPDGTYTLRASSFRPHALPAPGASLRRVSTFLGGQVDVTVAGHPVTSLRLALSPEAENPLQVIVNRTSTQGQQSGSANGAEVFIAASLAGSTSGASSTPFAQGIGPGTLDTSELNPGSYWLHTTIVQNGLCESSFTAGGANLAREPLVVNPGGATAPLTLTLRDDCSSLTLTLPSSVSALAAGEEPAFTAYVVPDFDFTTEARAITLRASTGGSFTFNSLAPGSYHVYVFTAPVNLEYHSPEALAALPHPGQQITLSPGATSTLVVEIPQP